MSQLLSDDYFVGDDNDDKELEKIYVHTFKAKSHTNRYKMSTIT